jgi:feruloyl esterase
MGVSAQVERLTTASDAGAAACATLKGKTFGGDASVVESTLVPAGSLTLSDTVTIPNLPSFCRVQGVSKPSADSNIQFEVWLPDRPRGTASSCPPAKAASPTTQLSAQRSGQRDGRTTPPRLCDGVHDTGHVASEQWWAIGHPERIMDYLYRAKHVTTVASKAIVAAYGQPPARSTSAPVRMAAGGV